MVHASLLGKYLSLEYVFQLKVEITCFDFSIYIFSRILKMYYLKMYFPVVLHPWYLLMLIFSETDAKIFMPSYSLENFSGIFTRQKREKEYFQTGMVLEFQTETVA